MGRQSKSEEWLTEDALLVIKGWARDGLNNEQIAHNMGITTETLRVWNKRFPSISAAIKEGRQPVLVMVEDAFYSKCRWNDYEETREEVTVSPDGRETVKTVTIRHRVPPDTAALIFALKNLRPDKWRNKPLEAADVENLENYFEEAGIQ